MQEPAAERWQIVLVLAFLAAVIAGVFVANRTQSPLTKAVHSIIDKRVAKKAAKPRRKIASSSRATDQSTGHRESVPKPSSEPVATPRLPTTQGDCTATQEQPLATGSLDMAGRERLLRAVLEVDTNPPRALKKLEEFQSSAVAAGYRGYLLLRRGDIAEAEKAWSQARRRLPAAACTLSLPDPAASEHDTKIRVALRTIRLALELNLVDTGPLPIACGLFRTYPKESAESFGVMWGGPRDRLGETMKRYCVTMLLRHTEPIVSRNVLAAQDALCEGLIGVQPSPPDALFEAVHIAACDLLRDVILTPELSQRDGETAARRTLSMLTQHDLTLALRVEQFETLARQHELPLATGACLVLASRNEAAKLNDCRRRARQATLEGLASWLNSVNPPSTETAR